MCTDLGCTINSPVVRTAMETSFSVVYAIIFMIWFEMPIVNDVRFRQYIRLYRRIIDDLFLILTGPAAVLCDLLRALATADEAISLDWSSYKSHQEAVNPSGDAKTPWSGQPFRPGHEPIISRTRSTRVLFLPYRRAFPTLPQVLP